MNIMAMMRQNKLAKVAKMRKKWDTKKSFSNDRKYNQPVHLGIEQLDLDFVLTFPTQRIVFLFMSF